MRGAGESGEKEVLTYLRESLHKIPSYVLHNFHARIPNQFAIQIDYLIITHHYILMIEVKNIKGRITFRQNPPQLIRELDGEVLALDCPFSQLDRNLLHFKKLLGQTQLPIYSMVVWANRSANLEGAPSSSPHKLLFLKQLPHYLNQLEKLPKQDAQLASLVKRLKSRATPFYIPYLCERHGITASELIQGLICLYCYTPMRLHIRTWVCPKCRVNNTHMLEENILNVFDLLGDSLQMKELKQLLPFLYSRNLGNLMRTGTIKTSSGKKNSFVKKVLQTKMGLNNK